jgi:hypothetical protein
MLAMRVKSPVLMSIAEPRFETTVETTSPIRCTLSMLSSIVPTTNSRALIVALLNVSLSSTVYAVGPFEGRVAMPSSASRTTSESLDDKALLMTSTAWLAPNTAGFEIRGPMLVEFTVVV